MTKWKVTVFFVDTSYYDDGNRTTSKSYEFDTEEECFSYVTKCFSGQTTFRGQYGDVVSRVEPRDISIVKRVSIPWQVIPALSELAENDLKERIRSAVASSLGVEEVRALSQEMGWSNEQFYNAWREALKCESSK